MPRPLSSRSRKEARRPSPRPRAAEEARVPATAGWAFRGRPRGRPGPRGKVGAWAISLVETAVVGLVGLVFRVDVVAVVVLDGHLGLGRHAVGTALRGALGRRRRGGCVVGVVRGPGLAHALCGDEALLEVVRDVGAQAAEDDDVAEPCGCFVELVALVGLCPRLLRVYLSHDTGALQVRVRDAVHRHAAGDAPAEKEIGPPRDAPPPPQGTNCRLINGT
mmetsp:Transcript_11672/g.41194  ORF Transcript_11672/g.41194 Transcript_11672/m.41194 type:complete len:220 (+) Transcript_11672:842-1501(+)